MIEALQILMEHGFLRRALLAAIVVAVLCAVLGVFLVLRGFSLLGEGLAHISFAGFALGAVLSIYPVWLALVFAIAGALAIQYLRERGLAQSDTSIGIVFTTGLAFGVLLVSYHRSFSVDVESMLFGNLLAVTSRDVMVIATIGTALVGLVAFLYKEFFYVTLSEEAARLSGVPVNLLNTVFITLTAASIVMAARIVGILLVSALIIIPAATSLQFARSFKGAIALSVAFGITAVVTGVAIATQHGLATGATVALMATALFVGGVIVRVIEPRVRRVLSGASPAAGARER